MNNISKTANSSLKALVNPDNKLSLIPNWLSFSRAIGGVAIPIMVQKKSPYKVLIGTISFIALSDFLDGLAARKLVKEETEEGAMLDAISDKIFSLSLIIGIAKDNPTFIINGALESVISIINAKMLNEGEKPQSNKLGKLKIWPLSLSLISGYSSIVTNNKNLMVLSTYLNALTALLEIVNIKEYSEEYKKFTLKR